MNKADYNKQRAKRQKELYERIVADVPKKLGQEFKQKNENITKWLIEKIKEYLEEK